jgi:hypothetical protein
MNFNLNNNEKPFLQDIFGATPSSKNMSGSELDVEQSSSSAKEVSVLLKSDSPVWETGQSNFPRLADFASSF